MPDTHPLLEVVMVEGHRVRSRDPVQALAAAQARFETDLGDLPGPVRRLRNPAPLYPTLTAALARLTNEVRSW
jgi:hypothetical protein